MAGGPIYKGGIPFFKPGVRFKGNGGIFTGAGTPTNGTSGSGAAKYDIGSIYLDTTNGHAWVNQGTKASPTWNIISDIGSAVGGSARTLVYNVTDKAMGNAAAAISLFTTTQTANTAVGGALYYNYFGTDGTDTHSLTGMVTYAAVMKTTALTLTITEVSGNQAKAVSGGTITIAWTAVDSTGGVGTYKAATTDSLTTTTAVLSFTIVPMRGAVTLL